MRNFKFLIRQLKKNLFKIFIIILTVIFILKLIKLQNNNIRKEKELAEINKKVEDQIKENQYIQKQINSNMSNEYKENYAREELNMIRPNERVVFDITKE